jgi:hypothetical protein
VQDLGYAGLHARALARGKDDDVDVRRAGHGQQRGAHTPAC